MSSPQNQPAGGAGPDTGGTGMDTSAGMPPGQVGAAAAGRAYVPPPSPGYDEYDQSAADAGAGPSATAVGFTALAAVLMMLSGVANFLEGLAAVIKGSYFVSLPNYAYNVSVSGWGWTHLIVGIVVFAAGACLFLDMLWARVTGIVLASLSLLLNLVYIPYFPVWSIIVIAIDAFVIWALLTPRRSYA